MKTIQKLADCDHPAIQSKAHQLISAKPTNRAKVESIFLFVRDEIKFGFPPKWDEVKASETLSLGLGYCNTKISLFLALCQASHIPARVHFGLLDIRCMQGIFPSYSFSLLPKSGAHAWVEVQMDDQWKSTDSYIEDKPFYEQALRRLQLSKLPFGFGIAPVDGQSSCEINFDGKGFIFKGAIVEDHGTWEDAADYYTSDKYIRMTTIQKLGYPMFAKESNRNIEKIRSGIA